MRNKKILIALIAIALILLGSFGYPSDTRVSAAAAQSLKSKGINSPTGLTEDFNDLSEWNVYYDSGGLPPIVSDGKLTILYPPELTSGYLAETYLLSKMSVPLKSTLTLEFRSATDKDADSTDNRDEFSCFMVSDTTNWIGKEFGFIFSLKDDCNTVRPYIQVNGNTWITPTPVDVGNLAYFKDFKATARIRGKSVLFKWYVDGKLISSYALVDSGWNTEFKAAIVTHNWGIVCPPRYITYDSLGITAASRH